MVQRNTGTPRPAQSCDRPGRLPCALCGKPIDYSLCWPDPRCFGVDHKQLLHRGGPDTLANKQAAHRDCNRAKGARLDGVR